ncbi:MAG: hypothetical protein G3M78_09185 [Candidatus Nitrohelix vancouverensis]|uniref:Uncharacterized protein n=1 Tax=Candidatus Nitrohelix vancouverensis TaxID=2705534 RepID=A0A7T0G3L9_9BACT|nr:MAG: hypothetical protein G3M78_09185 [Candidatus Nitrohelix vancouverensis]
MLETLFIAFLLLLFISPKTGLAALLGLWTTFQLHRAYRLGRSQPREGRPLLRLSRSLRTINALLSLALAAALAGMVYFIILENRLLFVFNLMFCFAVALRWFDFTFSLFHKQVARKYPELRLPGESALFAICLAWSRPAGFGVGLSPVFFDAGYLHASKGRLEFNGALTRQSYLLVDLQRIEKLSSDGFRIVLAKPSGPCQTEILKFRLKYQFYPFKSRIERDRMIYQLTNPNEEPA